LRTTAVRAAHQSELPADAVASRHHKETRDFIKDKMRSAVDLLRNIEHRRQTIYRVVESIVHRQKDFLDHGVQHIKPMMLKDIAEDIGMHLSTVSRVVNRKYAHTPREY
jgi:RNA polymerase sigma-54 factor